MPVGRYVAREGGVLAEDCLAHAEECVVDDDAAPRDVFGLGGVRGRRSIPGRELPLSFH